jgi:alcohol dehydrogenase
VAVFGCGGVGLAAIMIANAVGAQVVAVDIDDAKLDFARSIGAHVALNSRNEENISRAVRDATGGGAHVSIDALGSPGTCFSSIASLRKRGKHVQVGLLLGEQRHPPVPMDRVIAYELEILGSHGIQAYKYGLIFDMIRSGKLDPSRLVGKTITLDEALAELIHMDQFSGIGIAVINRFT